MSHQSADDEIKGKIYDGRLVRRLLVFVRPYWRRLTLAVILLLVASLAELVPPLLLQQAIDGPILQGELGGLWRIFALYMGVLLAIFGLRYAHTYIINSAGQQVMQDIRIVIFRHIQRMSLSFFDRNPVGRLLTRITNDVDALNEFLTQGFIMILADTVTLIGIIGIMLVLNWRLALISIATLPVLTLIVMIYQGMMRTTYRMVRQRLARINAYLNEHIGGVLVTQLFNREQRSQAHFADLNADYLQANMRALLIFAIFIPSVNLMAAIGTAAVLYGSGQGILAGWASLGMLAAFVQYTERAFQPIRNLAERYTVLQSAMAASERIFGVLDTPEEIRDPEHPVALPRPVRGEIEFRDVVFGYDPAEPVLKGINLHIPAGQAVAIVGATGAGKSSLVALLARFYDVQQGGIFLDGVDIRHLAQHELRRHVAAVPQDPVCFSGTIASNIRLHSQEMSAERMRWAAELVNAAVFIEQFPDGYDHEVRERGSNLSVGQRQLLAFARALAFNPEVLLILDEATSSVDTATEALIQDALARMLRGRTSIVIAHRLSTIQHVDRIVVLHQGQIVEDGSHAELLAQRGFYHRLYHLQFAENTMHIEPATREDAAAILHLQHRAYQREAELYNDWSIPPLTQTLDELLAEFDAYLILKASIDGQLVGAVRAQISDGICHIGRLMVEPSYQGRGIGQRLMQAIEAALVPTQCYELFTGDRSARNVALYEYLGYRTVRTAKLNAVVTLVYMQKDVVPSDNPQPEG